MVILYVDDDPEDIEIFEEAVKETDSSIRCLLASNGKQAMEILQMDPMPDFIFLDINMPVINGKSVLLEIRKDKKFNNIPIVMYSTAMSSVDVHEYKKMGADFFLKKHDTFQQLCEDLSAILRPKLSGR
ncbi:MAG TPA: response regulator [Chryseosolibacter sp.]|nr:response regulator [Chryseosolibacter sp.]